MTFSFSLPKHSFLKIKSIFVSDLIFRSLLNSLIMCVLVTQSCPTLRYPTHCSPPGSSVHGFSRQEYWSGMPFPSPGDHLDQQIELRSSALQVNSFLSESPKSSKYFADSLGVSSYTKMSSVKTVFAFSFPVCLFFFQLIVLPLKQR